jgi:hypothetical protein
VNFRQHIKINSDFQTVNFRTLKNSDQLFIRNQCIWTNNYNVQTVNIRQIRKVTMFPIRSLCIFAKNSKVQTVNSRKSVHTQAAKQFSTIRLENMCGPSTY